MTTLFFAAAALVLSMMIVRIGIALIKITIRLIKGVIFLSIGLFVMDISLGSNLAATLFTSLIKALQ